MSDKLDYDLDELYNAVEVLNASGLIKDDIEVDEDNPDEAVQAFLDAFMPLEDEDVEALDKGQDLLDFVNKGLPDRFFPGEGDEQEGETEKEEKKADKEKSAEKVEKEKSKTKDEKEKSDEEFSPECPSFGEFDPKSDECKTCAVEYEDEYDRCVAICGKDKTTPKKVEKEEKKSKKPKDEEEKSEDDPIEEKPKGKKAGKKTEKSEKKSKPVEKEPEEKPKKGFRGKPKKEESEETSEEKKPAKESTARRKASAALTGRRVAEFFKRASLGGIFDECVLDCQKSNLVTDMANAAENVLAHFVSSFSFPHIGKIGIGGISKIVKFCSSVGDSEVEIEITDDRLNIRATGNKVQLLLADIGVIQTDPKEVQIDEVVEMLTSNSIITPDQAKDVISDIKLIKSDKLCVEYEDEKLSIVGGDASSDKFRVMLRKPEVSEQNDAAFDIHGGNFSKALATVNGSDEPIELLFNVEEDCGAIVIRQGEDIIAFSTGTGEEE